MKYRYFKFLQIILKEILPIVKNIFFFIGFCAGIVGLFSLIGYIITLFHDFNIGGFFAFFEIGNVFVGSILFLIGMFVLCSRFIKWIAKLWELSKEDFVEED